MAMLKICTYPDPVLAKQCREVEVIDEDLKVLARDMAETMFAAPGLGLAAPQVGRSIQLIVVDKNAGRSEAHEALALYNPRIVESSGSESAEEGCLSLPEYYVPVTRAEEVVVHALDSQGKPVEVTASGLLARCLQHEIDHLKGTLTLDHQSSLKRAMYKKRIKKEMKRAAG